MFTIFNSSLYKREMIGLKIMLHVHWHVIPVRFACGTSYNEANHWYLQSPGDPLRPLSGGNRGKVYLIACLMSGPLGTGESFQVSAVGSLKDSWSRGGNRVRLTFPLLTPFMCESPRFI